MGRFHRRVKRGLADPLPYVDENGTAAATWPIPAGLDQLSSLATLPIMTYKSGTSGVGISARAGGFAKNLPQGA
jgi:hypothetical protein